MVSGKAVIKRLLSSAGANALAVGANQAALLIAGIIVAQILGREAFGKFSMLMVTTMAFASVGQLSLGITATKFVSEFRASSPHYVATLVRLVRRSALAMGVGIGCLLILFHDQINARAFASSASLAEMIALAAIVSMQVVVAVQSSAVSGFEAYRAQAVASWGSAAITVACCAALATYAGILGAIIGVGIGIGFRWLLGTVVLLREVRRVGDPAVVGLPIETLRQIKNYAVPAAFAGLTGMPAIWLAAAALTSRPGGVVEYALYAAAYNIKTLILFVPSVVATVTVPRLSFYLAANDDAHVRKTYFVAVATSFAVLAAAASVSIFGTEWILAVFGSDFSSGSGVFILVLTTGVVEGLCITLYSFFQATGRLWLPFLLFTIPRDVTLVVSAHILCPIYGARGLAIAAMLAATYTICATLALLFIRERRHLLVTSVARSGQHE